MQYFNPKNLLQINPTLVPARNLKPVLPIAGETVKVNLPRVNDNSDMLSQKLAELKPTVQAKLKEIYGNSDDLVIKELKVMKELEDYAKAWLNGTEFNDTADVSGMLSNALNERLDAILERLRKEQSVGAADYLIEDVPSASENVMETRTLEDLTGEDLDVISEDIDYSEIVGYYANKRETLLDTDKNREKTVNMLDAKLRAQLKSQVTKQMEAMGLKFADIENVFNNVFTQTAWDIVESSDKGLIIKYNVADLIDKFIEEFNKNLDIAIAKVNASDKDLDLQDIDYTQILKKYDVESGSVVKAGSRNSAREQAQEMANLLKAQLQAKAKAMCTANGITYSENSFNTQFNNSVAYAMEHCDMSYLAKKYNPQEFITIFLTRFEQNYTSWVNRQ